MTMTTGIALPPSPDHLRKALAVLVVGSRTWAPDETAETEAEFIAFQRTG